MLKNVGPFWSETTTHYNPMDNFYKKNREKELCVYLPKKAVSQFFIALIMVVGVAFTGSGKMNAQCTVTCNSDVQVSLFNPSNFTVTYDMVLVNSGQNCQGANFLVQIFNEAGQNIGNQVNASHIGVPLSVLITNTGNGNSCSANLSVVDDLPPVITCQNKFVSCSGDIAPSVIGYPSVSDNITPLDASDLEYTDVYRPQTCSTVVQDSAVTARVDRIWRVTDGSGNLTTKIQAIYYVRRTFADIVFPKNRDGQQAPYLKCQRDDANNLNITGVPTIDGKSIHGTGHCDFSVTFTDDAIINCTGEKEINRRWSVTDWCLDSVITYTQRIVVRDEQAPTLTCPDTIFLNTKPNACTATVTLPAATATDSCSTPTVSVRWQFGSGYGPFQAVPTGSHKVTYTAADACGNVTTCATTVIVKDNQPPTAICAQSKEIILLPDGTAIAYANSFDGGSHDNCGIDGFAVARDNLPFSNTVKFTCADAGKTVVVKFRVIDRNNLYSECTVNVQVLDRTAPVINCPANKTLACQDDPLNLILTGTATATDACSAVNVSYTDNAQLNNCGNGFITRTWKATDASGNFSTCVQQITVQDNTPVSVVFPDDYTTYTCGAPTSPDITGRPVLTGDDCEDIEITFTEQYFGTAPPACFRIIRRWVVVDWCKYVSGSGSTAGYWTKDQTIQVLDETAPVLTPPADQTVGTLNTSCEGFATIPPATAADCSPYVSITNDSPYSTAKGADASGTYPPGVHTVKFTATDGCGNQSTATMKVTVKDDKAPTPICGNGISLSLNSDGLLNLHPLMVLTGSFDNCSPASKLQFDISPKTFDCSSVGAQIVRITAKDEAGNSGFCTTTVNVQDNLNACSATTAHIAGKVMTMGGTPGVLVQVELSGGLAAGRQTNVDGSFEFRDLPKNKSYTVTPRYNTDITEGVTTFDLVHIQKHILNVQRFTSPYQWIAADANNSKDITTFDLVIIRKAILRVNNEFPNNKSWRFVDASFEFPATGSPLQANFPESIHVASLNGHRLNSNFVAIKIGDVNSSAKLNTLDSQTDDRTDHEPLSLLFEDAELKAGQTGRVDITSENFENITGFQFTLDFDKDALEFARIENMSLNSFDDRNVGTALLHQGSLTFSWDDSAPVTHTRSQTLFSIYFTAKKDSRLSACLNASSQYTRAEAYQVLPSQNPTTQHIRILNVHMKAANAPAAEVWKVFSNKPNPFTELTSIPMQVPKTMDLTLTIFDLYGREVTRMKRFFPMGYHEWMISDEDMQHRTGVFLYRIEGEGLPAKSGKMTRLRN